MSMLQRINSKVLSKPHKLYLSWLLTTSQTLSLSLSCHSAPVTPLLCNSTSIQNQFLPWPEMFPQISPGLTPSLNLYSTEVFLHRGTFPDWLKQHSWEMSWLLARFILLLAVTTKCTHTQIHVHRHVYVCLIYVCYIYFFNLQENNFNYF